jgi:hypothetical protein
VVWAMAKLPPATTAAAVTTLISVFLMVMMWFSSTGHAREDSLANDNPKVGIEEGATHGPGYGRRDGPVAGTRIACRS